MQVLEARWQRQMGYLASMCPSQLPVTLQVRVRQAQPLLHHPGLQCVRRMAKPLSSSAQHSCSPGLMEDTGQADLELDWQAMAVPTRHEARRLVVQQLELDNKVLQDLVQGMACSTTGAVLTGRAKWT